MTRPLVIGNWKMNGTLSTNEKLLSAITNFLKTEDRVVVGVCPSFTHLYQAQIFKESSNLLIGSQNISEHSHGAFTGEVNADMLIDLGVSFTLVGHSERRVIFGETDETITKKVLAALRSGLMPVLCVGETLQEREAGTTQKVIKHQVESVLNDIQDPDYKKIVIAYEPVWAIGTGLTATPEQAQEIHAFIRGIISKFNREKANSISILYGGSVNSANALDLMKQPDIDGALVGGASLDADSFIKICLAAAKNTNDF